jgi:4-hydroxy-tetrahydrodipicolinate reductase
MTTIKVLVAGPGGRMGSTMIRGLPVHEDIEVIGGLSRKDAADAARLSEADVLVDFTNFESAPALLIAAIEAGVRPVSGTSNMPEAALASIDAAARAKGIGAAWCSNFRLGGVLMQRFAKLAAPYFDEVEIVEAHHAGKVDAPSGASLALARAMRASRGSDFQDAGVHQTAIAGTRGGVESGVRIHSLRLSGLLGRHEIVFSAPSELLTVRHDDMGREGYVPGVARAIRYVMRPEAVGLVRGYDSIIGLPQA